MEQGGWSVDSDNSCSADHTGSPQETQNAGDQYLVLSGLQKKYIAERLEFLVREQCKEEEIHVESSCEMIHR